MTGRVLIIAGSDCGGGAGIQADIKTVTALGGYAATAITALTVQDTKRVYSVLPTPPEIIRQQIECVLEDIGADCVKVGMIGSVEAGRAILAALAPYDLPLVLDPVLVATSGDRLGGDGVAALIRDEMIGKSTILTPNAPEAAQLSGQPVESRADFEAACAVLAERGAGMGVTGIMAKAGHLAGAQVEDFYYEGGTAHPLPHPRLDSTSTHGTGCTLAAAIAVSLAQGMDPAAACRRAVDYVTAAIQFAPGLGAGHGPLNHALTLRAGRFSPIKDA